MSMIRCDDCGDIIDSDDDPECFIDGQRRVAVGWSRVDLVWCENCREDHAEAEHERQERQRL